MDQRQAVKRVLTQASKSAHFFDLSDSKRLCRMIGLAFDLGRKEANGNPHRARRPRVRHAAR